MTVNATTALSAPQVADGSNRTWYFPFKIVEDDQIVLYLLDAGGETRVTTGYSVVGVGSDNGGQVTYPLAPIAPVPSGTTVKVGRYVVYEQPDRLGNQGPYLPRIHEGAFDRLEMQIQQVAEQISRALLTSVFTPSGTVTLPPPDPGHVLIWDETGNLANSATDVAAFETSAINAQAAAEIAMAMAASAADAAASAASVASASGAEIASFKTRTLARVATISASVDVINVMNDEADGDGWRDTYVDVGSGPASDTVFQNTIDSRWWGLVTRNADDAGKFDVADGIHVPAWRNKVDLSGYNSISYPISMPFVRVGAAEPPDSLKFQDDGTDWWKLSRHYTTLKDHGYTRGADVQAALQRAVVHCLASEHCRTIVLEAPDEDFYTLTAPSALSANYHINIVGGANLAIIGPGRDLCRFKRIGTVRGMMSFETFEGLRLEGFSFDQDGSAGTGHHGLALKDIYGLRTDNLGMHNCQGYGIGVENTDETAHRIGRWLLNDTLIENAGSDGMDVKSPTTHNEQIVITTYRVKGWSLYHDADNALDVRFHGTIRDVDIEFTDTMGHAAGISLRNNQESNFSGGAFTSIHGVQIKGTRGNNTKYQLGVGAGGKRVNIFGLSARNLNEHAASAALSLTSQDVNVYGLNVDRCGIGVNFNASSNNTIYSPLITRCDVAGIKATAGSSVSNRVIAPRVEGCTLAYLAETGGYMTLERPKSYGNGDLYTLNAGCRVIGPADAVKTIPYASARLATTGYVNLLTGLANGGTIDGTTLATSDRVVVKDQGSAVATHTVRVASVVGTVLSTQYAAGKYLDGILLVLGDRILAKNQTTTSENGIYVVTGGAPTRATDADLAAEFTGMIVTATEGIDGAGKLFVCTSTVATVGSSAITFAEAGALNGVYVAQASGAAVRATDSDAWVEMGNATYYVTAGTTNSARFFTARGHNITVGTHPFTFTVGPAANSYEPNDEDFTLLCDATAAAMTIAFPSYIQDFPGGREMHVVKVDATANAVIINPISSQIINGGTSMSLTTQYEGARCKSSGSAWFRF